MYVWPKAVCRTLAPLSGRIKHQNKNPHNSAPSFKPPRQASPSRDWLTYNPSVQSPHSSLQTSPSSAFGLFLFGAGRNGFSGVYINGGRYRTELYPIFSRNSSEHVDSNRCRPAGRFQLGTGAFATSKSRPMILSAPWELRFRRGMPGMSGSEGFGSGRRGTGWGGEVTP